jgi:hypothetical protein
MSHDSAFGDPGVRTSRVRFGPAPRPAHWRELSKVAGAMRYAALVDASKAEGRQDPNALHSLATVIERLAEEASVRGMDAAVPCSYWAAQDAAFKWMADRLPAEEAF